MMSYIATREDSCSSKSGSKSSKRPIKRICAVAKGISKSQHQAGGNDLKLAGPALGVIEGIVKTSALAHHLGVLNNQIAHINHVSQLTEVLGKDRFFIKLLRFAVNNLKADKRPIEP